MSAGVHKVNTHCGFFVAKIILCKPITTQKNQRVETQNSCWTIRPGKQQHTVKNCSMTHLCGTNILSFLLSQKEKETFSSIYLLAFVHEIKSTVYQKLQEKSI